jgi:hypothetical protein
MTQKDIQKKRDINLEEDRDFYLSFVNKKLRNTRKKLEQIDLLLKKEQGSLKPEQIEKIRSREEVLDSIKYFEDLKDVYYSAYKLGLEEGKITLPDKSSEVTSERNDKAPEAPKVEKTTQSESDGGNVNVERIREEATIQTLKKVMHLISVGQFFNNSSNREAFLRDGQNQGLASDAQVDELQRLYKLINSSTVVEESAKVEEKYTQSFEKLVDYVQASTDNTKSTRATYEFVENVANSTNFKTALVTPTPKKEEEKTVVQVETTTPEVTEEKPTEINVILELLPNHADFLKPDSDDVNKSPENMKYLPKDVRTLKFVDEIEREHMSNIQNNETEAQKTEEGQTTEESALKESAEGSAENTAEKKEEGQRSFRKNRGNKRDKPRTENGEKAQNSGPQAKRAANHKENKTSEDGGRVYEKKAYNGYKRKNYEYEVREYVKKPAENKV